MWIFYKSDFVYTKCILNASKVYTLKFKINTKMSKYGWNNINIYVKMKRHSYPELYLQYYSK